MSNPPQPRKVIHLPKVRMLTRGGRQGTGIRITHVKSIKPPDPTAVKKQEEDKLRAQLQKEIVSRSRACAFKGFACPLPVLSERQYCARHVAHDPTAPYSRCAHERCSLPAPPRTDNNDHQLCFEHARAALFLRQRSSAPAPPVTTTETLLNQLQHYVKPERARTTSCASSVSVVSEPAEQEPVLTHAVDPFKQIDATAVNTAYATSVMECGSCSDSDADSVAVCGEDGPSSGDEDAPVEDEPLWRAGVFTAEEAVGEARQALRSLQAAYIGQMGRLRTLLQRARADYITSLRAEKEHYCSINSQTLSGPLTVKERRQLRKLKAYASYRRKHGVEAVLARKLHRKRAKVNETPSNRPVPSQGRCTFTEGGVRCAAHVLPAARHCLKHIIHDRHQVLFQPCGDIRGGVECREPIPRLPLFSSACRYHTNPPVYTVFTLKKDDTDSESDSGSSVDSQLTAGELIEEAPPSETVVVEPAFG